MKRWLVQMLESVCIYTPFHYCTRGPFVWLNCLPAVWAFRLDHKWGTEAFAPRDAPSSSTTEYQLPIIVTDTDGNELSRIG